MIRLCQHEPYCSKDLLGSNDTLLFGIIIFEVNFFEEFQKNLV